MTPIKLPRLCGKSFRGCSCWLGNLLRRKKDRDISATMRNGIAAYGAKLKTRDTGYNEILMYAKFKGTVKIDLLASLTAISNKLTKGSNFAKHAPAITFFFPFCSTRQHPTQRQNEFFLLLQTSGSFRLMCS